MQNLNNSNEKCNLIKHNDLELWCHVLLPNVQLSNIKRLLLDMRSEIGSSYNTLIIKSYGGSKSQRELLVHSWSQKDSRRPWRILEDTGGSAETERMFKRASEFEHPKFSSEPSEFRAYLNLISITIAETEQRFERARERV